MTGFRVLMDACVYGWETLEESIRGMPDPDDRHVVAAAVRGSASAIVTDNVRDFPGSVLEPLGLHVRSSDRFLLDLLHRNPEQTLTCIERAAGRRSRPPISATELLVSLEQAETPGFAREAKALIPSEY